ACSYPNLVAGAGRACYADCPRGGPAMTAKSRTGLIALAVVGGVFVLAALGVGALVLAQSGKGPAAAKPRPDKEGKDWTHKELVEYLTGKGCDYTMDKGGSTTEEVSVVNFLVPVKKTGRPGIALEVHRYATADKAKEKAGTDPTGFSWGRFYFNTLGDAEY